MNSIIDRLNRYAGGAWGSGGGGSDGVPYTGATSDINLGVHGTIAHRIQADASDGLLIEAGNGTDVGTLGTGNTANVIWEGTHKYNALNASRALIIDSNKNIATSTVTDTELGRLSGISSNINALFELPMPQNIDYPVAGGVSELTNGTPTYAYIVLAQQKKYTSITFLCTSFTSTTAYELCFYTWAISGPVSKYGAGTLANGNCTGTGKFTLTFATPVTLPAGVYNLGILKVSGSSNIVIRTGISNSSYMFLGAAGASALPATESTRNSQSGSPYMEPL